MSVRPLVSAVIPTYNNAPLVVEAVESALAQTYSPLEVIVVDDGSDDDTAERLVRFGQRIRLVRIAHAGPAVARNAGIRASRGEFIALLDSDDLWLPEKVARSVQPMLDDPSVGAVYTDFLMRDTATGREYRVPCYRRGGDMARDLFLECRGVCTPTVVVRRTVGDAIGWYDESLFRAQDWDLLIRLAERTRFRFVPEALAIVREHPKRLSVVRRDLYREYNLKVIEKAVARRPDLYAALRNEALSRAHFRFAMMSYGDLDLRAARRDLARSLRLRPTAAAVNYLLRTLLPRRLVARLRRRRLAKQFGAAP